MVAAGGRVGLLLPLALERESRRVRSRILRRRCEILVVVVVVVVVEGGLRLWWGCLEGLDLGVLGLGAGTGTGVWCWE